MLKKRFAAFAALLALAAAPAAAQPYQDGVYRDLAPGYNDEVIVTVTVRGGAIAALSAENRNTEESDYFRKAEEGLAAAIVEKQAIEGVDAVAGATGTSESILTAMKGILEQMYYTGMTGASDGEPANPPPAGSPDAPPDNLPDAEGTPDASGAPAGDPAPA